MPETHLDPSVAMILGEVRGQLREIIHTMNNERAKQDGVLKTLAKLESVPDRLDAIEKRLLELETDKTRRGAVNGLLSTILKSPAIGWLIGAAATVWMLLHDRGAP